MINEVMTDNKNLLLHELIRKLPDEHDTELELLIKMGESFNLNDLRAFGRWLKRTSKKLESFPSEYLTFRMHCLEVGTAMLSIALEKEKTQ